MFTFFAFEELYFKEHGYFVAGGGNLEGFGNELLGVSEGRVCDYVTVPMGVVNGEEVGIGCAVVTVYEVGGSGVAVVLF